jgi:hypothetical protein
MLIVFSIFWKLEKRHSSSKYAIHNWPLSKINSLALKFCENFYFGVDSFDFLELKLSIEKSI